jgi:orotate phosphoribosyltransferase
MQCARLFEHPAESGELCADLAGLFGGEVVNLVAGPALGGIIMAYETARALGVRNIFAEREGGVMTFRRGFAVAPGTRVLVVEDVVTTGGSVREVIELIRAGGAEVVGVGAIVDRSGGGVEFGVPFRPLLSMSVESWNEADCPLCREGRPIAKPGSRAI